MTTKILALLLASVCLTQAAKETDLTKGLDLTGRTNVSGSTLNQLVDAGTIRAGKGALIVGFNAPDVYLNPRYTNWLWLDTAMYPPVLKQWISGNLVSTTNANSYTNWASITLPVGSLLNTNQFSVTATNITLLTSNIFGDINTNTHEIYLAPRTDGRNGSGIVYDPYNVSTAIKFDNIMSNVPANTVVHLMEGTYLTKGFSPASSNSNYWLKDGVQVKGAGMYRTKIRLSQPDLVYGGIAVLGSANYNTNNIIEDLTLDCNHADNNTINTSAIFFYGIDHIVRNVRVVGWGNNPVLTSENFVLYLSSAEPNTAAAIARTTNANIGYVVESCVFENPDPNAVSGGACTLIGVGGCVSNTWAFTVPTVTIKNNKIDVKDSLDVYHCISAGGRSAFITGNEIYGSSKGVTKGYYGDTGSQGNHYLSNNKFVNVVAGIQLEGMGATLPSVMATNSANLVFANNYIMLAPATAATTYGIRTLFSLFPAESVLVANNYIGVYSSSITNRPTMRVDPITVSGVKRLVVYGNTIPAYNQITGEASGLFVGDVDSVNIHNNYRYDGSYAQITASSSNLFSGMPYGFSYNPDMLKGSSIGRLEMTTNWSIIKAPSAFHGIFTLNVIDTNVVTNPSLQPDKNIMSVTFAAHLYNINGGYKSRIQVLHQTANLTNVIGPLRIFQDTDNWMGIGVTNLWPGLAYNLSWDIVSAEQQIGGVITTNVGFPSTYIRVLNDPDYVSSVGRDETVVFKWGTNHIIMNTNMTLVTNTDAGTIITNVYDIPNHTNLNITVPTVKGTITINPVQGRIWLYNTNGWDEFVLKSQTMFFYGPTNLPTFNALPGSMYFKTNDANGTYWVRMTNSWRGGAGGL